MLCWNGKEPRSALSRAVFVLTTFSVEKEGSKSERYTTDNFRRDLEARRSGDTLARTGSWTNETKSKFFNLGRIQKRTEEYHDHRQQRRDHVVHDIPTRTPSLTLRAGRDHPSSHLAPLPATTHEPPTLLHSDGLPTAYHNPAILRINLQHPVLLTTRCGRVRDVRLVCWVS